MWSNSAHFLMVRLKLKKHQSFTFPIPLRVINESVEALGDLVWIGEVILKWVPLPQEARAREQIIWVKTLSLSKFAVFVQSLIMELNHYKGLDLVDMDTEDVQVRITLR